MIMTNYNVWGAINENDAEMMLTRLIFISSKIEQLKLLEEAQHAKKISGYFPNWATLQTYQFYFADLLVHDIKKVKRLH